MQHWFHWACLWIAGFVGGISASYVFESSRLAWIACKYGILLVAVAIGVSLLMETAVEGTFPGNVLLNKGVGLLFKEGVSNMQHWFHWLLPVTSPRLMDACLWIAGFVGGIFASYFLESPRTEWIEKCWLVPPDLVLRRNALFYGFLIHSLLPVLLLFLANALTMMGTH